MMHLSRQIKSRRKYKRNITNSKGMGNEMNVSLLFKDLERLVSAQQQKNTRKEIFQRLQQ
jgi:hypothetical protein